MKGFLKADLHIHSSFSFDCNVLPKDIVSAAVKKGLKVIGVTDHGTIQGSLETLKIAKGRVQVLIGQEVMTKSGELLVFNLHENMKPGEDVVKACRRARDLGGFIVVPHPFDPLRHGVGKDLNRIAKMVDAIEGFNPKCFFERSNKKAEEFAESANLPLVANSDAHKAEDVGMAHTLVRGRDVFEAIRSGDVEMVKKPVGKRRLLKRRVKKIIKKRK